MFSIGESPSPPEKGQTGGSVLFLLEIDFNSSAGLPARASSWSAADGGRIESEKGENKERRERACRARRGDYVFERAETLIQISPSPPEKGQRKQTQSLSSFLDKHCICVHRCYFQL